MQRKTNDMSESYNFGMVMHIDCEDYFLMPSGSLHIALQENNFPF